MQDVHDMQINAASTKLTNIKYKLLMVSFIG